MKIEKNSVVEMHYSVATNDGTEIDSSIGGEPLEFIHGMGFLIPGLENELKGKTAGDKFNAHIPAADAYGEHMDELVQVVPMSMFQGMDVQPGMQFRATTEQGEQSVIIIDVSDDEVAVDGNHPLSGQDLSFSVEILSVREATAEELESGQVQSTKCCDDSNCSNNS